MKIKTHNSLNWLFQGPLFQAFLPTFECRNKCIETNRIVVWGHSACVEDEVKRAADVHVSELDGGHPAINECIVRECQVVVSQTDTIFKAFLDNK